MAKKPKAEAETTLDNIEATPEGNEPETQAEGERDIITALQADILRMSQENATLRARVDKLASIALVNYGTVV